MTPYFSAEQAKEYTGLNDIEICEYGCPEVGENYHVFINGAHHFAGREYECKIFLAGYVAGLKAKQTEV